MLTILNLSEKLSTISQASIRSQNSNVREPTIYSHVLRYAANDILSDKNYH